MVAKILKQGVTPSGGEGSYCFGSRVESQLADVTSASRLVPRRRYSLEPLGWRPA